MHFTVFVNCGGGEGSRPSRGSGDDAKACEIVLSTVKPDFRNKGVERRKMKAIFEAVVAEDRLKSLIIVSAYPYDYYDKNVRGGELRNWYVFKGGFSEKTVIPIVALKFNGKSREKGGASAALEAASKSRQSLNASPGKKRHEHRRLTEMDRALTLIRDLQDRTEIAPRLHRDYIEIAPRAALSFFRSFARREARPSSRRSRG